MNCLSLKQPNNMTLELLNEDPRGLILYNKKTNDLFINRQSPINSTQEIEQLIQYSLDLDITNFTRKFDNKEFAVTIKKLVEGYIIITEKSSDTISPKEKLIRRLINATPETLLDETVKAISQVTGWKWIGISRFVSDCRVEVLSMCVNGEIVKSDDYNLIGTPCELVASSQDYTFFSDVTSRYPHYTELEQMGAKTYAGLIYESENTPIGHIFGMHEQESIDAVLLKDLFNLAASMVGSLLEVASMKEITSNAILESHIDVLTGLLNRRAFERDISNCINNLINGKFSDSLLGIIDLDDMKNINDTWGHDAGDLLLANFAEAIKASSRPEDKIYRIGGDEFALILNSAGKDQIKFIQKRLESAITLTKLSGFPDISASFGFASFKECSLQTNNWFKLADERMYQHKRQKNYDSKQGLNVQKRLIGQ